MIHGKYKCRTRYKKPGARIYFRVPFPAFSEGQYTAEVTESTITLTADKKGAVRVWPADRSPERLRYLQFTLFTPLWNDGDYYYAEGDKKKIVLTKIIGDYAEQHK